MKPLKILKGFTLIELVVVLMITAFLSVTVGYTLTTGFNNYFSGKSLSGLNTTASIALFRLRRDLESAVAMTTLGGTQINFTLYNNNAVQYRLNGTQLLRQENGGGEYPLAERVDNLAFSYFDASGAETSSLASVRLIQIALGLSEVDNHFNLITTIYLRQL